MSKLMLIASIVLVAVAVALGLMIFFSTGPVVAWGLTPEVAAILLVGGVLSLGLGGVILTLEGGDIRQRAGALASAEPAPALSAAEAAIPEFGRRLGQATVATPPAAATATAAATAAPEVSPAVAETISALERATADIRVAFGEESQMTSNRATMNEAPPAARVVEPPPAPAPAPAPVQIQVAQPVVEEPAEAEEVKEAEIASEEIVEEVIEEDGQLYVVEERIIRARPARILSDGTVEAETDEGWMRFENLEHLDEYLDAMAPAERG